MEIYLLVLDRLLRATTKIKNVSFLRKKVHSLRQNPGYAYGCKEQEII